MGSCKPNRSQNSLTRLRIAFMRTPFVCFNLLRSLSQQIQRIDSQLKKETNSSRRRRRAAPAERSKSLTRRHNFRKIRNAGKFFHQRLQQPEPRSILGRRAALQGRVKRPFLSVIPSELRRSARDRGGVEESRECVRMPCRLREFSRDKILFVLRCQFRQIRNGIECLQKIIKQSQSLGTQLFIVHHNHYGLKKLIYRFSNLC